MDRKVEVINKEIVFNDFFKIEKAKLKYEKFNGAMSETTTRLNFERGDAAAAIVYNTDTGKAILVNQFRYPCYSKARGWLTEIVAGMMDSGETPEETIRREILEEIGYKVQTLQLLSTFFVSPGGSSERIFLYLALVNNDNKINKGGGLESENEDLKILEYNLDELSELLSKNELQDAKTIIAVNYLLTKVYGSLK